MSNQFFLCPRWVAWHNTLSPSPWITAFIITREPHVAVEISYLARKKIHKNWKMLSSAQWSCVVGCRQWLYYQYNWIKKGFLLGKEANTWQRHWSYWKFSQPPNTDPVTQMPKPERPAYDVENRQKPSGMRRRDWNTRSLPCVRCVRTSASREECSKSNLFRNPWCAYFPHPALSIQG